jgi:hypothetical protein
VSGDWLLMPTTHPRMTHLGHVTIGGERYLIEAIRLAGGKFQVDITLPPATFQVRGHLALYGRDGKFITEGKRYVIPQHEVPVCFTYELGMVVDTRDSEVNLGDQPGWH